MAWEAITVIVGHFFMQICGESDHLHFTMEPVVDVLNCCNLWEGWGIGTWQAVPPDVLPEEPAMSLAAFGNSRTLGGSLRFLIWASLQPLTSICTGSAFAATLRLSK